MIRSKQWWKAAWAELRVELDALKARTEVEVEPDAAHEADETALQKQVADAQDDRDRWEEIARKLDEGNKKLLADIEQMRTLAYQSELVQIAHADRDAATEHCKRAEAERDAWAQRFEEEFQAHCETKKKLVKLEEANAAEQETAKPAVLS